jgi:hypothetical protein
MCSACVALTDSPSRAEDFFFKLAAKTVLKPKIRSKNLAGVVGAATGLGRLLQQGFVGCCSRAWSAAAAGLRGGPIRGFPHADFFFFQRRSLFVRLRSLSEPQVSIA